MGSNNLARISWEMGQTLLPEHIVALEDSILAENRFRFNFVGFPLFGVASLQWNESLIKIGILSLTKFTFILPGGEIIDISENSKSEPFNLNTVGTMKVTVYFHILKEKIKIQVNKNEVSVPKIVSKISLSSQESNKNAFYTAKFAVFRKNAEGMWELSGKYVPPLVQLGTSPFFKDTLEYLKQSLDIFHLKLEQDITSSYLSGEDLFKSKHCLQEVYKFKHFLCNLNNQIKYHPFELYERIKLFYLALCFYQNYTPQNVEVPYNHEKLADCFEQVAEPLFTQIKLVKTKVPYLQFAKQDGQFIISKFPREVFDARAVYFLIQKPSITTSVSITNIKLASKTRIDKIYQMALQGIPLKKINTPPFQHTFGAEIDFYRIIEGEEWDKAIGDSSLAFYDQPDLEEINAYLYWRQD